MLFILILTHSFYFQVSNDIAAIDFLLVYLLPQEVTNILNDFLSTLILKVLLTEILDLHKRVENKLGY